MLPSETAPGGDQVEEGRFIAGIADIGGDIVVASVYAISGATASRQLSLWKQIVGYLKTIGLPFVVGGDWQVHHKHLRQAGLPQILDAEIIAPDEATCPNSGNTLDDFIVSTCLLTGNEKAEVLAPGSSRIIQ